MLFVVVRSQLRRGFLVFLLFSTRNYIFVRIPYVLLNVIYNLMQFRSARCIFEILIETENQ